MTTRENQKVRMEIEEIKEDQKKNQKMIAQIQEENKATDGLLKTLRGLIDEVHCQGQ